MKSILVTGGAGFIGSHTCLLLLDKGYDVFIIDSFINSSKESLKRILLILKENKKKNIGRLHLLEGDLKKQSDIEKIFQLSFELKKSINAVLHFAGLKSVSDSIINPLSFLTLAVSLVLLPTSETCDLPVENKSSISKT